MNLENSRWIFNQLKEDEMKKLVLLTFVLVALALSAFAQGDAGKGITAKGFKVGVTMANLTGDIEDTKMKIGFAAGGFFTYSFSPTFAIQPEVLYCMKGAKADTDEGEKLKLDYLAIPVMFKYSFPTEGKIAPNIFAGPEVGILLSAKEEDEDIKEYFKSVDFGIGFGAGIDIAMESGKLTLDARYTLGLSNIADTDEDESDFSVKNATIMVMLGYGF